MEVKSDYAVIMSDSGCMEKISKKKNMNVGQKIYYFDEDVIKVNNIINFRNRTFIKTMTSLAALILIAFTFFYQMSFRQQAYAIVSLDINPSIQIEVDSNQNIIKVDGMNDDAKKLNYDGLKGMNIKDGIAKIKDELVKKDYLKNNKDVLVAFALVNKDEDETYEKSVEGAIKSSFDSKDVTVTFVKGKQKDIDEAKSKGISLGRYEVAQISGTDESKVNTAPVKEITQLIKDKQNVIQWTDEAKDDIKVEGSINVDEPKKETEKVTGNSAAASNIDINSGTTNSGSSTAKPSVPPTAGNDSNGSSNVTGEVVPDNSVTDKKEDVVLEVQPDPEPEVQPEQEPTGEGETSDENKDKNEENNEEIKVEPEQSRQ